MNNSTTIGFMTTSLVAGLVTLYAYKRGCTADSIFDKLEVEKEKFQAILESIIELGKELIEKLYLIIKRWVEQLVFKTRLVLENSI